MFLRGFFSTHGFLGFSNGALDQTGIWLKPQTCLHQNHIVLSIQVVQALKIEGFTTWVWLFFEATVIT